MEQKLRQKRQTLGMVQASERPGKPRTLELRPGVGAPKRELHGKHQLQKPFVLGFLL